MEANLLVLGLALVAAGIFAGLIAGLFGIGGGVVIVPTLYHVFGALGVPDESRMHAAVATSLATIVVTSLRSAAAHRKRGAVDAEVVRTWAPWIVLGALVGSLVARLVSGAALTGLFGVGALFMAARMAFWKDQKIADELPTGAARAGLATAMGFSSSWMGIGGGVFGVMMMTLCGRSIHQAVGTAAAFGAAIGAPAALGFIVAGIGVDGLAPWSLGYVNLPGFAAIATLTTIMAPLGARLAHGLSQTLLKRLFALGLSVVATQMLWETAGAIIRAR